MYPIAENYECDGSCVEDAPNIYHVSLLHDPCNTGYGYDGDSFVSWFEVEYVDPKDPDGYHLIRLPYNLARFR